MLAVNVPEWANQKYATIFTMFHDIQYTVQQCAQTYHRLYDSSSPVLTSTHHSNGNPSETFWLFSAHPWRSDPQLIFTQNGLNDVDSHKDVPFAVKIATIHTPWCPGSLKAKRSKFGKFLDLENFHSIWPLTLEVQRENTPYSSSEPNESDI